MAVSGVRNLRSAYAFPEPEIPAAGRRAEIVVQAVLARRSVSPRRLRRPGPGMDEIRRVADAVAAAPDHGALRPARLIHIRESRREALAGLFEAALLERDPEACSAARARARDKARNGAVLVALVARITRDHSGVPESEQWVSVGAALQNALLTVEALGYRGMIVSGPVTRSRSLRVALGVSAGENLVGFIAMGTPAGAPKKRKSRCGQDLLTVW